MADEVVKLEVEFDPQSAEQAGKEAAKSAEKESYEREGPMPPPRSRGRFQWPGQSSAAAEAEARNSIREQERAAAAKIAEANAKVVKRAAAAIATGRDTILSPTEADGPSFNGRPVRRRRRRLDDEEGQLPPTDPPAERQPRARRRAGPNSSFLGEDAPKGPPSLQQAYAKRMDSLIQQGRGLIQGDMRNFGKVMSNAQVLAAGGQFGRLSPLVGRAAGVMGGLGAVGTAGVGAVVAAVVKNAMSGLGMARQGVGMLAGGVTSGNASGAIKGLTSGVMGLGSVGMGPLLGPVQRMFARAISAVIDGLDSMADRLKDYNASIGEARGKYEAAQQKYNVTLGKVTAPLLTAWENLKTKVVELMGKLAPIFTPLMRAGGRFLDWLGKGVDAMGKAVDGIKTLAQTMVAAGNWIAAKLNPAAKPLSWDQAYKQAGAGLFGGKDDSGDKYGQTIIGFLRGQRPPASQSTGGSRGNGGGSAAPAGARAAAMLGGNGGHPAAEPPKRTYTDRARAFNLPAQLPNPPAPDRSRTIRQGFFFDPNGKEIKRKERVSSAQTILGVGGEGVFPKIKQNIEVTLNNNLKFEGMVQDVVNQVREGLTQAAMTGRNEGIMLSSIITGALHV